ncbi:MAG: PIN domain-containing protein [Candidatus Micrarchaeota archaeon]
MLVVDTNVIIAAAIARGKTLDIIYEAGLSLAMPQAVVDELAEHLEEIGKKSGLDENELNRLFGGLFARMRRIKEKEYKAFKSLAREISPDKDDWPFFALALKEGCAIWSNDKRLKRQSTLRIIDTGGLIRILMKKRPQS